MFPRLQYRRTYFKMQVGGKNDIHDVDIVTRNQRLVVFMNPGAGMAGMGRRAAIAANSAPEVRAIAAA